MSNFKWYRKLRGGYWYLATHPISINGEFFYYWFRGAENIPPYFTIVKMEKH